VIPSSRYHWKQLEEHVIVVSGANGQLGRAVVDGLLERVPAGQLGVSVRDPEKAAELAARGVRVRRGDFDDPASLAHAFEDATQVLVVSTDSLGEEAVRRHRSAIETAASAGAKRILYTSHMGANPASPCAPMPDHAATEAALMATGVPFTALRNGFYASSAVMLLHGAVETGELVAPQDGPVAWTTPADLAAAAVHALTTDDLDGITPPLTGPEALDLDGVARIASAVAGRPVRRVVVSDAEYRERLVANGVPGPYADLLIGMFAASRQGDFAPADPTLARLLGRPATALVDVLKAVP
jgi:NAD(P)H dehydrogenase (quinone)